MTGLEGLPAELRKAVMTGRDIAAWEAKQIDNSTSDKWRASVDAAMSREYLPADLVEKEMRNHDENLLREIKELIQRKLKNDNDTRDGFAQRYSLNEVEIFIILEAVFWKKVEGAFR